MKQQFAIFYCLLFLSVAPIYAQSVDKAATIETQHLLMKLQKLKGNAILFGHQDDLAYGVEWQYKKGRSDVKETAGQYPALYGWELGRIEYDSLKNLDGVPFEKMKLFIAQAYQQGSLITISWHLNNPLTGKTAWDPAPGTVESVLPGGQKHELFTSWLDKVAAFMLSLKGSRGEYIPVVFRPFHELNGSWFWWGKNHCTPDQVIQLYRFTETYLRVTKNVHNLLYAFNGDGFTDEGSYLERYPGDDYVDILGYDNYQGGNTANAQFESSLDKGLTILESIAEKKSKVAALTEFGYNKIPDSTWWTNVLYKAVEKHNIAYMLAWRNAGKKANGETEFYTPYKGHVSAADFKKFAALPKIIFQNKVKGLHLYKK